MSEPGMELVERLIALLGLANRAGRLAVGYSAVANSVRRGHRPLLVMASDIGAAQKRKIVGLEPVTDVIDGVADKGRLGHALGRKELSIVAVEDRHFIRGIRDLFEP